MTVRHGARGRRPARRARRASTRRGTTARRSRGRRRFTANTAAPASSYAVPASSPVGGRGRAKYPINSAARARNAIARVRQHGTPAEKRMVYAKVRSRYPGIAARSSVIPTRGGSGRRSGQRRGKRS